MKFALVDGQRTAGINVTNKAAPRASVRVAEELHLFSDGAVPVTAGKPKKKKQKRS
jgi:hypothetical protein